MIDEEQYITTQHQLVTLAGLVKDFPLSEFINAANMAESIGPLIHPTLYRSAADKLSDVKALAEALLPFKTEVVRQLNKALKGSNNIPDGFNLEDAMRWYINQLALGFGADFRDRAANKE